MKKNKHAYLIIADKDDLTFRTLLQMLDDSRNDIYIHMDSKLKDYNEEIIENIVQKGRIIHIKRTNVQWGGYSLIQAELSLLEKAIKIGRYLYYHLLSGQDLPIQTQDYIHKFFNENRGKEFIHFQSLKFSYYDRVRYYYFFQDYLGRGKKNIRKKIVYSINVVLLKLQKIMRLHRNLNVSFQKGSNWFDITDDFARYVISEKKWIEKTFKYTFCGDEIFLQTLCFNSNFKNNLYDKHYDNNVIANMRLIDWTRGDPYVFCKEDFVELKQSNMLFARKFSCTDDSIIISCLEKEYGNEYNGIVI